MPAGFDRIKFPHRAVDPLTVMNAPLASPPNLFTRQSFLIPPDGPFRTALTFSFERVRVFAILIAIFLATTGSKLWLVSKYGSDVPFWDQWDGEGELVYKPLLDHGFFSVDWISAHNEHRIALVRATSALLLFLNGQWDPLVQMLWEAFCVGAIASTLCAIAFKLSGNYRAAALLWILTMIGMGAPHGWENSLAAFQTPFYYLIFLSCSLLFLCSEKSEFGIGRAIAIPGIGVLLLFTLASGVLTCLSASFVLFLRVICQKGKHLQIEGATAVALLALAISGFLITPTVAHHEVLRARNPAEWWATYYSILGWPIKFVLLKWLPVSLLVIHAIRTRRISSAYLFVFGLAAFVVLNTAAIALARGASINGAVLNSRYTDIAWLGLLVNLWAAIVLAGEVAGKHIKIAWRSLVVIYFAAASTALVEVGLMEMDGAIERGRIYAVESENVRAYVASGEFSALSNKAQWQIPFPSAEFLRKQLDDSTIRSILPPGIRPTLLKRNHIDDEQLYRQGFVRPGVPVTTPPAPTKAISFGSHGVDADRNTGRFSSDIIDAQGSYLSLEVSGYLGTPGLSMYLESVPDNKKIDIIPRVVAGNSWQKIVVKIPGQKYRIVAEDLTRNSHGWFAFTDPVELGRLRPLTDSLLANGLRICLAGIFLFMGIVFLLRLEDVES